MARHCPWLAALGRFGNVLGLTFLVFSCLHETNFFKCKWEINVNTFSLSVRFQLCLFVGVLFSLAFLLTSHSNWFFFPLQSSCFFSDIHALALAPGVGDMGGGRSTEQGIPLWKNPSSHQSNRTTEQPESFWVLSAPCSRISVFPAKALLGSSVPQLKARKPLVGFYYMMGWCREKSSELLTQLKACAEFLGDQVVLHNLLLPKQVMEMLMFLTGKCLLVNSW